MKQRAALPREKWNYLFDCLQTAIWVFPAFGFKVEHGLLLPLLVSARRSSTGPRLQPADPCPSWGFQGREPVPVINLPAYREGWRREGEREKERERQRDLHLNTHIQFCSPENPDSPTVRFLLCLLNFTTV